MTALLRRKAITHSYLHLLDERYGHDAARRAGDLAYWVTAIAEELGWGVESAHLLGDAVLLDEISMALLGERGHSPHVAVALLDDAIDEEQAEWVLHQDERWDQYGERTPEGSRIIYLGRTWVDLLVNHDEISAITACWSDAGRSLWPDAVQALTRVRKA